MPDPPVVELEEVVVTAKRPDAIDTIHDYSEDIYNQFGQPGDYGQINALSPKDLRRKRIIQLSVAIGIIAVITGSILIYQHLSKKNGK